MQVSILLILFLIKYNNLMQENILKSWLSKRHISDHIISEFGVHWGHSPIMGSCIVIPIQDFDGLFSFNKYRRNPMQDDKPKYIYDKGSKISLYGWWKAKTEKSILITEGEMDSLVAWSANIPAVSSTGGASSFQSEWAELFKDKDVTICFDNDSAGGVGMVKTLKIIPHAYVVFLPDRPGIKDISDYIMGGGDLAELLRTRIKFNSIQDVIDHKSQRLSLWQSTWFHDNFIEEHTTPSYVKTERKTINKTDEISIAKTHPISNLVKFNSDGKALCIWHNERTPSMQYYPDTNTVYCFGGCGKYGDVIDVYRQIHNCTFKEAIKKLI